MRIQCSPGEHRYFYCCEGIEVLWGDSTGGRFYYEAVKNLVMRLTFMEFRILRPLQEIECQSFYGVCFQESWWSLGTELWIYFDGCYKTGLQSGIAIVNFYVTGMMIFSIRRAFIAMQQFPEFWYSTHVFSLTSVSLSRLPWVYLIN